MKRKVINVASTQCVFLDVGDTIGNYKIVKACNLDKNVVLSEKQFIRLDYSRSRWLLFILEKD